MGMKERDICIAELTELGERWAREAVDAHENPKLLRRALVAWPALARILSSYAAFVTPWFPLGQSTVLAKTLDDVARVYGELLENFQIDSGGDPLAFGRLVAQVFASSETLVSVRAGVRISAHEVRFWEPGEEPLAAFWLRLGERSLFFVAEPHDYALSAETVRSCLAYRLLRFHEVECMERGAVCEREALAGAEG